MWSLGGSPYYVLVSLYASANNSRRRVLCFGLSVIPAGVCPSVRRHVFPVTQYLREQWKDFNETECHKCSSCEWALLKRFSRREVIHQTHFSGGEPCTFRRCGVHVNLLVVVLHFVNTSTVYSYNLYSANLCR